MASDVRAMYTINNATIFHVVRDAVVGNVDLSCVNEMSMSTSRVDKNIDTSRGSVLRTWTQ